MTVIRSVTRVNIATTSALRENFSRSLFMVSVALSVTGTNNVRDDVISIVVDAYRPAVCSSKINAPTRIQHSSHAVVRRWSLREFIVWLPDRTDLNPGTCECDQNCYHFY